MAFCVNCGRELQEGEVCNCLQAQHWNRNMNPNIQQNAGQGVMGAQAMDQGTGVVNGTQYGQGMQGNPYNYVSRQPSPFGMAMREVWKNTLSMFKDPLGTLRRMEEQNTLRVPMFMVLIHIVALFLVAIFAMIVVRLKVGEYSKYVQLPYAQIVLVMTVFVAAMDFMSAGVMLLCTKVFFGEQTSFAQKLSVVGGRAVLDTIFSVGGLILAAIAPVLGGIVIICGTLFSSLVYLMGFQDGMKLSDTRKFYAMLLTLVINAIGMFLLYLIFAAGIAVQLGRVLDYLF